MTPMQWLELVMFAALLLAISLFALSASGHFPKEHRSAALASGFGSAVLFGSMAVSLACLAGGIYFIHAAIPWYAAVIGGGMAMLAAPLLLQPFSDAFVNGRASLLMFTALAVVLTSGLAFLS
jgi:hypothetical protein